MSSTQSLSLAELTALLQRIFERHGTSRQVAGVLSDNCARAQRDGSYSHGVFRIPGYLSSLASNWVNGQAVPVVEDVAAGFIRVDAAGGFAQPALAAARELLVAKARSAGIAVLAIRNSHHFAALWPDVEPFAEEGLVALSVVNSMTCVVPHGARRPLFGTNPIAFAAPCAGHPPIVFDMATSAIAHGDVQIAARKGHELPAGMGVDRRGEPTQDPKAILDGGALLPFGGHKGYGLGLMVEVLGGLLSGAGISSLPGYDSANGTMLLAIDAARFVPLDVVRGQMGAFAERIANSQPAHGFERVLLPGEPERIAEEQRSREGIPIPPATWAELQQLRQTLM